jgi:ADP-heptose:LPS heptosyltransferase
VISLDLAAIRRILLVRLTSFGDVVRISGLPSALRRACPEAEITIVTDQGLGALFEAAPDIDRLILSRRQRLPATWRQARAALRDFRRDGGFDLAIDLQGRPASAAWTYASGAAIKAGRGGFRPGWRFTQATDYHASDTAEGAAILERLGIPVPDPAPVLHTSAAAEAAIETVLGKAGMPAEGFLLVNPFSRWPTKAWPLDRYAALLPQLRQESDVPIAITAGASEAAEAKKLVEALPAGTAVSLAGRLDLAQLLALLRRARLVLTGDSGPMHAADALGTKVVALFGPTWPERAGPWRKDQTVIQRWRSPRYHAYRQPESAAGMAAISVDEVRAAVMAALA